MMSIAILMQKKRCPQLFLCRKPMFAIILMQKKDVDNYSLPVKKMCS